jgi:uncharacterized repeat protein (TIGR01451 family)
MTITLLGLGLILTPQSPPAQAAPTDADDWPMYMHDPAHSGRTPATVVNTGPLYLQWAYAFGERVEIEAQPVIADGVIYQGVMNGEMHALNADTGAAIWIKRPGGPIPHTAAVADGRVIFGSLDGKVYALSTANGNTTWAFTTGGPVVSAPAVVDGRVYIGSNDGCLYALNASSGAELWRVQTSGPVVSSPAVRDGRVYFGSEDLKGRAANAVSGALLWETPLYGTGMHNTHPVVSDNGQVVIFVTVKPGGGSYVPREGYPNASSSANPVETWNTYYQHHPTYRTLYYLNAATGADLWNPASRLYVPMPIPYWGLLAPILSPDGNAWFPSPAGTQGYDTGLEHDNRLIQIDLTTGVSTQRAGPEFQLRLPPDETGRHIFSGNDYYYTISEDLGVYRPASGTKRALFTNGDPTGYNFGTHMDPLSPLPSRHLWRYGGAIAIGGVPGASVPIVANGTVYYTSYSWLYAVGPTDRGLDPARSFPARDARLYELTYPRSRTPSLAELRAEISQRVADIIARGPDNPPLAARWEQAGDRMLNNESTYELYGFEADLVRVLAAAYPHLSTSQQAQLRAYLSEFVADNLLNQSHYDFVNHCLVYGEPGLQIGDANCYVAGQLASIWSAKNYNLIGLRLYALWAYANATGDWASIQANWSFILQQFQVFVTSYDASLGYCNFENWRTGRLNLPAQIAAAEGMRNLADHLEDTATRNTAQTLLTNLLAGRLALAGFVPHLYDTGQRQPAPLRLDDEVYHNGDFTLYYPDIMGSASPYNRDLIPYSAALRDRATDPSQVNWWDGSTYRVDAGIGFMYYPALSGYFPLTPELTARLRTDLLDKTRYYVQSYEVNNPWWWMADLAHSTTGSGEHLYHSPTLSWTLFQVKAQVLQEDWNTLALQLPEPVSFNTLYDLYRLENLITLIDIPGPDLSLSSKSASNHTPFSGEVVTYTITLRSSGSAFTDTVTLTDTIPAGLNYVPGSLSASLGAPDDSAAPVLRWSGSLGSVTTVTISYAVEVIVSSGSRPVIQNTATIQSAATGLLTRSATIIANGYITLLPMIAR